jgi:hypothetical protein
MVGDAGALCSGHLCELRVLTRQATPRPTSAAARANEIEPPGLVPQ